MSTFEQVNLNDNENAPVTARTARPVFNQRSMARFALYVLAVTLTLWIIIPLYFVTASAFSTRDALYDWPKSLFPNPISFDTMDFFLNSRGVYSSAVNSLIVGIITLVL